jgi:uncharacterized membrane protein
MTKRGLSPLFLLVFLVVLLPFTVGFAPQGQAEPPADPLLALVIFLYGLFASWVLERWGSFGNLTPAQKQLTVALVGFVAPFVTALGVKLFGAWPETVGSPETFTTALLTFIAPFVVAALAWLSTQVGHFLDQILARLAGKG